MKKNIKTALYVGLAGILGYLGYTWYMNSKDTKTNKKTGNENDGNGIGNTSPLENDEGLAIIPTDGAVEIEEGGIGSVSQEQPIVFGSTTTGLQVEVLEMANGVYEFTPIYDETGSLGINDSFLGSCSWLIDSVNIGTYNAESSILAEFTNSGTFDFECRFNFAANTSANYPDGASFLVYGAINVLLSDGVPIVSIVDFLEPEEADTGLGDV